VAGVHGGGGVINCLDSRIRECIKCQAILASHPVDPSKDLEGVKPKPVVSNIERQRVMLVGQAPGLSEYRTGKPFSGQAGKTIFDVIGLSSYPRGDVYETSITKCYPGRKNNRGKWEDRLPKKEEIDNCLPFLKMQIEELKPRIIICLGSTSTKWVRRLYNLEPSNLAEVVGNVHRVIPNDMALHFLFHSSGANRALNDIANKKKNEIAAKQLREALQHMMGVEPHG
jgi:uracil-DNA glycosylase family 4